MNRLNNYFNKPHRLEYAAIAFFIGLGVLKLIFGNNNDKKYTIYSQDKTYCVDTFRVYGGQLNFDEGDKSIIVKGNYIIEINR
jgi:hypothetical protein